MARMDSFQYSSVPSTLKVARIVRLVPSHSKNISAATRLGSLKSHRPSARPHHVWPTT